MSRHRPAPRGFHQGRDEKMANHPNRSRSNLLYIDPQGFAVLTVVDTEVGDWSELTTCHLHEGQYIRIDDDGRGYPQLCKGGSRQGWTLQYGGPEQLARDCGARLFKTRRRYEEAQAKLEEA